MIFRLLLLTLALGIYTGTTSVYAFVPNIAVSIKPLYGIVSALTLGVTTPTLLVKNNASAHHLHLHPSQLSQLNSADLIVFVHPNFEAGFKKILSSIENDKKIMLSENYNNHHLWLDVDKMIDFSQRLSKKLSQIDKANQAIYHANLITLTQKLQTLKANIKQQLAPYKHQQVAVFSNAFFHFLNANQLKSSVVVNDYHGTKPRLFKILNARKSIKKTNTKCLLSTTEVRKKTIQALTENLNINAYRIDIIGNGDYFKLMNNVGNQISQCLK